jgi:ElaB/YqjD/DUF883 family membrane-anchored ribosome-binding protein
MHEPRDPEVHHDVSDYGTTARERTTETGEDLRHRAETLTHAAQERMRVIGDMAGERTREAVDQIRYFSEEARTEAAQRLEQAGVFVERQMGDVGERSRTVVRGHPGLALMLAIAGGFLLGLLSRRLFTSMGRRW